MGPMVVGKCCAKLGSELPGWRTSGKSGRLNGFTSPTFSRNPAKMTVNYLKFEAMRTKMGEKTTRQKMSSSEDGK